MVRRTRERMKGHWSRFPSLHTLQCAGSKCIKTVCGRSGTNAELCENPETEKQRTSANFGLDEAPVAKLRSSGQIAARRRERREEAAKQSENAAEDIQRVLKTHTQIRRKRINLNINAQLETLPQER